MSQRPCSAATTSHAQLHWRRATFPQRRVLKTGSQRTGFTLVELVTNIAVVSVLMAGMASTIKIARLAIPTSTSITATTINASDALEIVANDLRYATSIPSQSATSITLTVPDRDGQAPSIETIGYSWSGTAGAPLVRTFNGVASNLLNGNSPPACKVYPNW